ncbi:MAG: HEPN domain-containing protein [Anaerolineaceae bacterium]|nr:HEPN domain-containing protein [Anaerolineaceae bacterium]MCB9101203.1 HEPN domain-containing protein [Anaerolineales bacterium]
MKSEQVEALLRYRLEQARDTLRESEILLREAAWRGAINRAYYAMFYGLLALLVTKQLGTSKHSGALSLFDREFVKTGLFAREYSRWLRLAFNLRQTQDYGEMVDLDPETAEQALANAKKFVDAVETYLVTTGSLK